MEIGQRLENVVGESLSALEGVPPTYRVEEKESGISRAAVLEEVSAVAEIAHH